MKYTQQVTINAPLKKVIKLFDNPDNMKHWQPGFVSFEHVSGKAGKPGAKSKLTYNMNGREFSMIETITVRNLPKEFSGTYEMKGMWNAVKNTFRAEGKKTVWESEHEFKFSGFLKILSLFMRSKCESSSYKFMMAFKEFVEKN